MVRTILVGLDGSAYSGAAVEMGIQWAKKTNAMLVGLGIIDEPTICKPEAAPIGRGAFKAQRDETLLAAARRTVEQLLARFALRCGETGVSCKLLEDVGLPADQICLESQRYDLILLGKQSYFHFETQHHADETLRQVLKAGPRPVITVPKEPCHGRSAVIAYDGSIQAARTLQAFQAMQVDLFDEVHVVAVNSDHAEGTRNAERAIDFLNFHNIKAQRHVIHSNSPAPALIETARQLQAGLLVMGAYGQSPLKELFFGSVTRTLLKEETFPLFLFH